jgi:hypothetical protein
MYQRSLARQTRMMKKKLRVTKRTFKTRGRQSIVLWVILFHYLSYSYLFTIDKVLGGNSLRNVSRSCRTLWHSHYSVFCKKNHHISIVKSNKPNNQTWLRITFGYIHRFKLLVPIFAGSGLLYFVGSWSPFFHHTHTHTHTHTLNIHTLNTHTLNIFDLSFKRKKR